MYRVQALNSISDVIYEALDARFAVGPDAEGADAVLVRSADMHETAMDEKLLAIARAGAGTNNIPIDRCSSQGIVVFNTPGGNANAVKELVLCALLLGSRRVVEGIEWAKTLKGKGDDVPKLVEKGKGKFVGPEIYGKRLAVIGLGAVGAKVANAAHALHMEVNGFDPYMTVENAWRVSRAVKRCLDMDSCIAECDYISLHAPLTNETRGYFNAERFAKLKKGAVLVNFSRAELVDSEAVKEALASGQLWSYVVDFPTDELLDVPGVICIPHLGASTPESEENCARMAASQLRDYLTTGAIVNSVNFPDCDLPAIQCARVTVHHENVPNMIGPITAAVASAGINISHMLNKSRKQLAYTVLDLDEAPPAALLAQLQGLEGVYRVRVLQA